MYRHISLLLMMFAVSALSTLRSQVVYEHVSNENIYTFIDELATGGIVELTSVVKPYSRTLIADKLAEANSQREKLTQRQQKELDFYMIGYKPELDSLPDYDPRFDILGMLGASEHFSTAVNPLGGYYKDDLLTMAIKPIWGIQYFMKEGENIYHRWGGAEAFAYVGDHWGFYASLRDNNETEIISKPEYFTLRPGGAYKGYDYSEMRGGITYAWKWGSVGLVKDHVTWGNNNHGAMIFSDRAPSFAQIKLRIKPVEWFELNYYHGWLTSMEIDSIRSYYSVNPPREIYRPKYIAANIFTFTPWKKLDISLGNSIIYSDMNVHPAYLIPVLFYKSVDHTVNQGIDNQNSQMFFDISSRNIRNVHLYGTLYIDELKTDRLFDPDLHNFWSMKGGVKTYNLGVPNLSLNFEYSMSMPITYEHRVPTLTFASNDYNLGYYLRDNSQEFYAAIGYKPIRGLHLNASYTLAQHGPDYAYDLATGVDTHPFLYRVEWENETIELGAKYEFINNGYVFAQYIMGNVSGDEDKIELYTPEFFRGETNIISAGFNIGF